MDENFIEGNFENNYFERETVEDIIYSKMTPGYLIARFSPYYYNKI